MVHPTTTPAAPSNGAGAPPPRPQTSPTRERTSRSAPLPHVTAAQGSAGGSERAGLPAPLIQTIERAALDGNVDPVKFDRLLMAQERIATRQARVAFDAAFAAMQSELPVIVERGELTQTIGGPSSSYALWEDINEAIKPVLSKFGFGLRFKTGQDHGAISVTAILSHAAGHNRRGTACVVPDIGIEMPNLDVPGGLQIFGQ